MINRIKNKIDEIYHTVNSLKDEKNNNLFSGRCGIALFNFYYAKYKNDQDAYDKGYNCLVEVLDEINSGFSYHTYATGIAGVGWTIEHLSDNDFLDVDTDDLLGDYDEYLSYKMIEEIKTGHFDYLHGAMGIGLYLLRRKKPEILEKYLVKLIDEIDFLGEKDMNGIKWKSVLSIATGEQGYSVSLSHGIASIALIMGKIYEKGINPLKSKKIIEGAVNYLLMQKKKSNNSNSLFPSHSLENTDNIESRLAWCYGDLGIATTLWQLSRILKRKDWEEESISILLHSANRRDLTKAMVCDAGLCHGTAGIAHVYNRMYLSTGISKLKEASEFWFEKTLDSGNFTDGLAGFKSWQGTKLRWMNDPGFLEGISGIGLALISAVSDIDPAWDECLLLS